MRIKCREAHEVGIVAQVMAAPDLDDATNRQVEPYLSAVLGVVSAEKAFAQFLGGSITDDVIDETFALLADTWETDEASEGIGTFLNVSPPTE